MLVSEDQIQNIDDIYVLKECWNIPCGFASNQKIIANRWMIPITYVAEQCSMSAIQVLEEFMFSQGFMVQALGTYDFIKAKANELKADLNAIISSSLKYSDGTNVCMMLSSTKTSNT